MTPLSLKQISSIRSILIVRLSAHGDVIHTLPLLTAIRQKFPNAKIGWLVDSSAAPLLQDHPAIDHLHVWPRQFKISDVLNPFRWTCIFPIVFSMLSELKAQQYEISLDAQGLFKSAIWPFLAGVPYRFGFRKTREWGDLFYNERLPYRPIRSANRFAVEQTLDLARAMGCEITEPDFGKLPVSETARNRVQNWLKDVPANKPIVVLAPFTRWESKHWEQSYWPKLINSLLASKAQIIIIGAQSNVHAVETIFTELSQGHGVINLAGQTDWTDLYALYERTQLMIGLDSGPLHIANAVDIPKIIGIYGPTPAGRTGPIGKQHTIFETQLPCQPCYSRTCKIKTQDCMRNITPEQVTRMALQYLESAQETRV
jgi:lipopolysaccharide heptosyltransferase I